MSISIDPADEILKKKNEGLGVLDRQPKGPLLPIDATPVVLQ